MERRELRDYLEEIASAVMTGVRKAPSKPTKLTPEMDALLGPCHVIAATV